MKLNSVKQSNWPFGIDESVQLHWISSPFKKNGKWMLKAYYNCKGVTKWIELDWGTLHALSIQHYCTNGKLSES